MKSGVGFQILGNRENSVASAQHIYSYLLEQSRHYRANHDFHIVPSLEIY